eukprot:GFUD01028531.1.p1 GENE.GFUD01028531.1~~GFUD01028531.1.p1  ORF type:complete len:218 (+),score=5.76 GFUD01028531.1:59-712(+)
MATSSMICLLSLLPFALCPSVLDPGDIPILDSYHTDDSGISVDAADTKLVYDLHNAEVRFEWEGSSSFYQVVPGLMAIALYNIAPCGVVLPFTVPYAGSMLYATECNAQMEFGYVAANGSTIIITGFKPGNTLQIPKGALHWGINKSCTRAVSIIRFFNGPDISFVRPDIQIDSIPESILNVSMGEELARKISELKKPNPEDPIVRCPKCMGMCGLA